MCPKKKAHGKHGFAGRALPCVRCRVQHTANTLPCGTVDYVLCRVPLAHGKPCESRSDASDFSFNYEASTINKC